jgi:hypothetical protein
MKGRVKREAGQPGSEDFQTMKCETSKVCKRQRCDASTQTSVQWKCNEAFCARARARACVCVCVCAVELGAAAVSNMKWLNAVLQCFRGE